MNQLPRTFSPCSHTLPFVVLSDSFWNKFTDANIKLSGGFTSQNLKIYLIHCPPNRKQRRDPDEVGASSNFTHLRWAATGCGFSPATPYKISQEDFPPGRVYGHDPDFIGAGSHPRAWIIWDFIRIRFQKLKSYCSKSK